MAKKTIKAPVGHVVLRHADEHASCTVDGVPYALKDGHVVVPYSAAEALLAHGFYADGTDVEQEEAPQEAEQPSEDA